MTHRSKTPPLWAEHLVWDDLPRDKAQALRARLGDEAELDALREQDAAHFEQYPAKTVLAEVQRRKRGLEGARGLAEAASRRRWTLRMTAAVPAVFVVLALGWFSGVLTPTATAPVDDILLKGGPSLMIYGKDDEGRAFRLLRGQSVSRGDVIQVGYRSAGAVHGVIVSVDGRGVATLHHPASLGATTALRQGGEVYLENAFELDDAPGFERFFFVRAKREIDVASVLAAARELGSNPERAARDGVMLALPETFEQTSMTLRKEAGR